MKAIKQRRLSIGDEEPEKGWEWLKVKKIEEAISSLQNEKDEIFSFIEIQKNIRFNFNNLAVVCNKIKINGFIKAKILILDSMESIGLFYFKDDLFEKRLEVGNKHDYKDNFSLMSEALERNPSDYKKERFIYNQYNFNIHKYQLDKTYFKKFVHENDKEDDYILSNNCYEWYYGISLKYKPKIIAEIGVRYGYSAAAMLLASSDSLFYGYDNESYGNKIDFAREKLQSEFNNVFLIKTDTQKCTSLPMLEFDKADIVHVDGDHSPQGCIHDCELGLKCLSDEGIIVVDDVDNDYLFDTVRIWASSLNLKWQYIPSLRGTVVMSK